MDFTLRCGCTPHEDADLEHIAGCPVIFANRLLLERPDPFYFEKRDEGWSIYIDVSVGQSQIIYNSLPDEGVAESFTDRLNNAVYRWMIKHGLERKE